MRDRAECEVCGTEVPEDALEEHVLAHPVVVMRDGWWGQFLTTTFVLDVYGILEDIDPGRAGELVPQDIRDAADRWIAGMGPDGEGDPFVAGQATEEDIDAVLDWSTYRGPAILADEGMIDVWEDGYVIYRIVPEGSDA